MKEQERPLIDRVWEFTKDISVKVSRKAEKHWKINTLRVEIASIKHRINVRYKELGRFVFESLKSGTLEEESYKASLREFFDSLAKHEDEIMDRENRIEILEREMNSSEEEAAGSPAGLDAQDMPVEAPAVPSKSSKSKSEEKPEASAAKPAGPEKKSTRKPRGKTATTKSAKAKPKRKKTGNGKSPAD